MSDPIETEIIHKGLVAPRVTPAAIAETIVSEYYFTAAQGADAAVALTANDAHYAKLSLLTICVLVLRNGFTVTGESACASPANFDAAIGKKIARQHAVEKIWPLEGYLLKQRLADSPLLVAGAA